MRTRLFETAPSRDGCQGSPISDYSDCSTAEHRDSSANHNLAAPGWRCSQTLRSTGVGLLLLPMNSRKSPLRVDAAVLLLCGQCRISRQDTVVSNNETASEFLMGRFQADQHYPRVLTRMPFPQTAALFLMPPGSLSETEEHASVRRDSPGTPPAPFLTRHSCI